MAILSRPQSIKLHLCFSVRQKQTAHKLYTPCNNAVFFRWENKTFELVEIYGTDSYESFYDTLWIWGTYSDLKTILIGMLSKCRSQNVSS